MTEIPDESLSGWLLVATQGLIDPNFAHSVVLVLDHDEEGAFGVVLNRPSDAPMHEVLASWSEHAAAPGVVFVGGPVQPSALIALGRSVRGAAAVPVLDGVEVVDLDADPVLGGAALSALRVFAGYAGWGAGQLEGELVEGGWFVVPATADDVFTDEPHLLWRAVLARQGGVFSTVPEDPSMN